MLGKLRDLFKGPSSPQPIHDDVLGILVFDSDIDVWEARAMKARQGWYVLVAGDTRAPDSNLLSHAREIASSGARDFHEIIRAFLNSEASRFRGLEQEVRSLKLGYAALPWPKRPRDGMLYFDGGRDHRLWRCDYADKSPRLLGFDT
jgi:hypothetical protein